ncbi:MAG TPA: glycine/sarcosine/betaine reductase complex component C subunit alpha [Clostridia bacterium]|nr:glycine/sarcosine/betaine reductase complex component C subunit alpha [Clostridia bacterium]
MANPSVEQMIAQTFLELADSLVRGENAPRVRIALTGIGSEHGEETVLEGALTAQKKGIHVVYIGDKAQNELECVYAGTEQEAHARMEELLEQKLVDGAVTMHYPFPIGVATVGRVPTPGRGREVYLATTTGTAATRRVDALVRNTVLGIAAAKACGIARPTVGLLNLDGARQAEAALRQLRQNGYDIEFAESCRADGGCVLRGNDLLSGVCDVMVCDSLTGNILQKMLSSFTTGGGYESVGSGYGPGLGEGFDKLVMIVSRASGAPVIAGALEYAAQLVAGNYLDVLKQEFARANRAGLSLFAERRAEPTEEMVSAPAKQIVTHEITGVEVTDVEDAVRTLWKGGIYAESGMGCTGPVILVAEEKAEVAEASLRAGGWLA